MIKLDDVIEANNLLVSMGGDDQLPRIASAAIERSLELQHRVDRALAYASSAPPNSVHARNMARILDGSITVDDELNEVSAEQSAHARPVASRETVHALEERPRYPGRKPGSKNKPKPKQSGLGGRSTKARKEFREWTRQQNLDLPTYGPVPQELVDAYDEFVEQQRTSRLQSLQSPTAALFPQNED